MSKIFPNQYQSLASACHGPARQAWRTSWADVRTDQAALHERLELARLNTPPWRPGSLPPNHPTLFPAYRHRPIKLCHICFASLEWLTHRSTHTPSCDQITVFSKIDAWECAG
jgi:hypothetical protein